MIPKTTSKKILFFFAVIIVSRVIYTVIGVYTRTNLLDTTKPFLSWTYNSPYQALNTWTVWDSGFYYQIASTGYPKNIGTIKKAEIRVPANSWVKVFLGYGEVGEARVKLPNSETEKINNTLFLIGSPEKDVSILLHGAYEGIPYCTYSGPIDFSRDVKPSSDSLTNPTACLDSACSKSYVTYYSILADQVVFQEYFAADSPNAPLTSLGESRPEGVTKIQYQGFGCKTVGSTDLTDAPQFNYKNMPSAYPFLPGYPYLVKAISLVFRDIVLSGLVLSNLALFLSAIFLYKLLKIDFDEKLSFYAVLFYLLYPLTFILSGFFSEAVFNLFVFAGFYFVRKGNFILGTLLGAFASVTRIVGLVLIVPFAYVYHKQLSGTKKVLAYLSLVLFPLLIGLHTYYLYSITNDWFVVTNSQQAFGRVGEGTISAFMNYLLSSTRAGDFEIMVFLLTVLVLGFTILKVKTMEGARLPIEYSMYSIMLLLIPLSSGILTSLPRYTLGIFPLYLGLSYLGIKLKKERLFVALSFVASCVLMVFWALSTRFIV